MAFLASTWWLWLAVMLVSGACAVYIYITRIRETWEIKVFVGDNMDAIKLTALVCLFALAGILFFIGLSLEIVDHVKR